MEGMREIARSYYERASEAEQISIIQSFAKLDVDGDGKISLVEFKKSVSSWLSAEAVFEKLDENGDGCLDFDEFLCLYYMEKKVEIARCSGCWDLLVGPYFSCLLCFGRGANTYDLCCACYRRGGCLSHEHSVQNMMDHHSLIMLFRNRAAAAEKSQNKKEMEELREIAKSQNKKEMVEIREIAKALHRGSSPQVQELATEFYQAMDSDGDGRVNLSEFLAFMTEVGYSYEKTPTLFDELDADSNGTLDFFEVMTLLYILKSGRPQCDCCEKLIPGVFFSCVECFKNPKRSFDLCKDCYVKGSYYHNHGGGAQFLDSHTLLQAMRYPEIADMSGVTIHEAGNRSTNDIVPSNSKWRKRKAAYYALDTAVKFGTISTFGFCTIM